MLPPVKLVLSESVFESCVSMSSCLPKAQSGRGPSIPNSIHHPPTHSELVSARRNILQDISLTDGTYLPTGTLVVGASWALSTPSAEMRCEKMIARALRTSSGRPPNDIAFGHGSYAWFPAAVMTLCTGRFFAANETHNGAHYPEL